MMNWRSHALYWMTFKPKEIFPRNVLYGNLVSKTFVFVQKTFVFNRLDKSMETWPTIIFCYLSDTVLYRTIAFLWYSIAS